METPPDKLEANFRDPVFVRNDDETEIAASVVEWNGSTGAGDQFSISLRQGSDSVLIQSSDWALVKSCIDCELNRVGAFDQ